MVGFMNDGWQINARCAGIDSSIFFLDESQNNPANEYQKFCDLCPVRNECLEYALLYNLSGVWGGTTDSERAKLFSKNYIALLRDDAIESGMFNFTLKA